jgi:hypothetical protein
MKNPLPTSGGFFCFMGRFFIKRIESSVEFIAFMSTVAYLKIAVFERSFFPRKLRQPS